MIVKIDLSFEKDVRKINDANTLRKLGTTIESCISANSIQDIKNFKKLSGFKNYYRIRLGEYRIGLQLQGQEIIFERILHRKEIYRFFP